jgi:hypothetical protein
VARPRQARTSSTHYEPNVDVDQFHAATDSMARVVQRVRGEQPLPEAERRPRRRARRERVDFHPAATAEHPIIGPTKRRSARRALRRAERRPQRSLRPPLLVIIGVLFLGGTIALALTAPEDDDVQVGADPGAEELDNPDATGGLGTTGGNTTTTETTTTTTEPPPPRITVDQPAPGLVAVTSPRARLDLEATEPCWISVVTDGGPSTQMILEPGQQQRFDAEERIEVRIGNPAGLQVSVGRDPVDISDHGGEPINLVLSTVPVELQPEAPPP